MKAKSLKENNNKPFNGLFGIVILPPDDCNFIPDIAQFLPHIIVGIEQGLSSLVNEVDIPEDELDSNMSIIMIRSNL